MPKSRGGKDTLGRTWWLAALSAITQKETALLQNRLEFEGNAEDANRNGLGV